MRDMERFLKILGFEEGDIVRPTKDYERCMSRSFVVGKILFINKEKGLLYIDSPTEGRTWISASWCAPVDEDCKSRGM